MQTRFVKQEAIACLAEYRNHSATLSNQKVLYLANRAVALFFEFYKLSKSPLRESIELLCEINASTDSQHVSIGLQSLFPHLIEKLNDAFLPSYCKLYDRVFAQIISFFRRLPEGYQLDDLLNRLELTNEVAILRRKQNLVRRKKRISSSRSLKKIIFLSRVTIGADVAITSVMIAQMKQRFPNAELILLGSPKLQQLYGGDAQIRIRPIDYGRGDNLLSRLKSWIQVTAAITEEIKDLVPDDFCLIDPDSRLTQLGLLPVLPKEIEESSYFFFESRSYSHPHFNKLGQLSSHWITSLCSDSNPSFPFVALTSKQLDISRQVISYLRHTDIRPVICISFGVGGNYSKRVSEQFEINLLSELSEHSKLVIDCGITNEEYEQVNKLLLVLKDKGKRVSSITESQDLSCISSTKPDVLVWRGSLGSFASLIADSNLYIGYDSAGQHIAAAIGVPTLTIFVNSGSNIFPVRWQSHGKGPIKTIFLPLLPSEKSLSSDALLSVLREQELLLQL